MAVWERTPPISPRHSFAGRRRWPFLSSLRSCSPRCVGGGTGDGGRSWVAIDDVFLAQVSIFACQELSCWSWAYDPCHARRGQASEAGREAQPEIRCPRNISKKHCHTVILVPVRSIQNPTKFLRSIQVSCQDHPKSIEFNINSSRITYIHKRFTHSIWDSREMKKSIKIHIDFDLQ
jgi:hypothetical protein